MTRVRAQAVAVVRTWSLTGIKALSTARVRTQSGAMVRADSGAGIRIQPLPRVRISPWPISAHLPDCSKAGASYPKPQSQPQPSDPRTPALPPLPQDECPSKERPLPPLGSLRSAQHGPAWLWAPGDPHPCSPSVRFPPPPSATSCQLRLLTLSPSPPLCLRDSYKSPVKYIQCKYIKSLCLPAAYVFMK